jgi:Fe-Mn family superoxide dismutase
LSYWHLSAAAAFADVSRYTDAVASRSQVLAKYCRLAEHSDPQGGSRLPPFTSFKARTRKGRTTMTDLERRDFIQGVGVIAGAATAATLMTQPALAQTPPQSGGRPMTYTPKPLSFDPKSINGISEKVLTSHYENNYVGAVRRLNAIGAQLAELDFAKAPNFVVNGLKREELIAANSMILHEVYFDTLGGGAAPRGGLSDAIARHFGSLERWRTEFSAMGKAQGGGSGWVILAYSPRDKRLVKSVGRRSYDHACGWPAGAGSRHVRARLSYGLWCCCRPLR